MKKARNISKLWIILIEVFDTRQYLHKDEEIYARAVELEKHVNERTKKYYWTGSCILKKANYKYQIVFDYREPGGKRYIVDKYENGTLYSRQVA